MRELEVIRELHRECQYVHLFLALVSFVLTVLPIVGQAHLQHYSEPPSRQVLATSSTVQGTIHPLGPGTFMLKPMPIITACTKAVLMDDDTDFVSADASEMGGMVKGENGRCTHRRDHAITAHNLLIMCVSLLRLPHAFLNLIAWQTAQASLTRHCNRRH